MKKSIIYIMLPLLMVVLFSCKKFADEKLVATLTNDYYKTEEGLEDLVRSAYEPTRYKFQYEQAYCLWNFGVDEYTEGDQGSALMYNRYDATLTSDPGNAYMSGLWDANYDGINRCNMGLELIPGMSGIKYFATDAQKKQRMAELRFLRGFYYFQLVQQFGGLPIVLTSTSGKRTDFTRSTIAQVYDVIISDLRYASDELAPSTSDFGRATKGAANHFLAKAYLTRGSAVQDQRGQKTTDMDSAAIYAEKVINNEGGGSYVLETDYKALWNGVYPTQQVPALGENGQAPSGTYSVSQAAQKSKEILFSSQYSNVVALRGTWGNRTNLYFIMQYDNETGVARDLFNGRPYRRLRPTDYTMDIYDRKNDSRFYKSFVSVYYSNTNASVPVFTTANAPTPSLVGKRKFGIGDTAVLLITNTPATALTEAQVAAYRYKVYPRYYKNAAGAVVQGYTTGKYLTLVKHLDPFKAAVADEQGVKDGIHARLGETYLIAAEAYGRKGDYDKALTFVNVLRQRAAYKANETKAPQFWLFEGGAQNDLTSTYPQLTATASLFTTDAASEKYPAGVTATPDRFIHFILNERCCELCGELYRWEDLVRTETLESRAIAFNTEAGNIKSRHKLRPIPQKELNLITKNGVALTAAEKQAFQNPGY